MKKIVIINHSDTRGGASVVSYRLMNALCRLGLDARMVVMHSATANPRVVTAAPQWRERLSFLAEEGYIYMHNGRDRNGIFRVSASRYGLPLERHPWIADADAIILGWINQGMLSVSGIDRLCRLGVPVAWTMHDMWPFTGVCHHAADCDRYFAGDGRCHNCPQLGRGAGRNDMSRTVQEAKKAVFDGAGKRIHFVAISNWLAQCAHRSLLLADADVTVIPNPFPVAEYPLQPSISRQRMRLPEQRRLIVMGAARLDDPVKNLPLAVEALNIVADDPRFADCTAVFYGTLRDPSALDGLRMPAVKMGPVDDFRRIASLYAHASAVLSSSRYETLPTTIVEGIAAGCAAATTGHGGQADIVTDGVNGYIAPEDTPQALAQALAGALTLDASADARAARRATVAARFGDLEVARRYLKLLFP